MSFWTNPIGEIVNFFTKPSAEQTALASLQSGLTVLANIEAEVSPVAALYPPAAAAVAEVQAATKVLQAAVAALQAAVK